MMRVQDMGTVRIVAEREIRETLRQRSFRISTLIQILVVAVVIFVIGATASDGPAKFTVGTVGGQSETLVESVDRAAAEIETVGFDDLDEARAALAEDEVDAIVVGGRRLFAHGDPDPALVATLQATAIRADGGDPAPVEVVAIEDPNAGAETVALIGSILLYAVLIGFGYTISSRVVEEKASRVIEVLLAAIRPAQLLVGKVVGVGLVGITQFAVTVVVGLLVAMLATDLELPATTAATVGSIALFFTLGYAFYSFAFATAGALVSRQEDASSTTSPLLTILVGGYVASTFAIGNPDGTLAQVMTFIPPLAPLIIPVRVATESITAGEFLLATVLMLAGIAVMTSVAIRIYRRTALRMGPPVKLAEAFGRGREPRRRAA